MIQFPNDRWTDLANELGVVFGERARKYDETDTFVAENYADLKAKNVFAAGVPTELGGGGASVAELAHMLRTFGRHCSSTALSLSMHTHLIASLVWRWRHMKAPVDGLLRRVAAENLVLVSTGGADWLAGSGKATKTEGGYEIRARKIFCSGAPAGDLMMTMAVYDDPTSGPTVLHFALPMNAPGVQVHDNWHTIGMRGTGSHDVSIDGAFIADGAVSGTRPSGKWGMPMHVVCMVAVPLFISAYVGVAEAARTIALEASAKKRDDRLVHMLAGEMDQELVTAQLALQRCIDLAMSAQPSPETSVETLTCRTIIGRSVRASVDKAMELAGGGSFFRSGKLERLFRDVQGVRFHPMQDKPSTALAGRHAFGLPLDE